MVKSKYFLLGYREIFVGEEIKDFVAALILAKIPFEGIEDQKLIIFEGDFERFGRLFKNKSYTASETLG